jgi:branched-chain amino acid transport system ATP-binding protein
MTLLRIEGVCKSFAGLTALEDVSFAVGGGIVGLIGPNGAGKTTLFNVIAGAYAPDSGRVVFRDSDVTGLPGHRIARMGLGRTFQLTRPFARMSVLDNVAVAAFAGARRRSAAELAARDVIERVGLERWMDSPAGELSTAGRKRLELARALALRPSLLLLDEVLAGLVPSERGPVIELLRELRSDGLAMVLVEHVMAAVMTLSDEVVVLHHGRLLASGTPEAITQDPDVVEAYLGEEFLLAEA